MSQRPTNSTFMASLWNALSTSNPTNTFTTTRPPSTQSAHPQITLPQNNDKITPSATPIFDPRDGPLQTANYDSEEGIWRCGACSWEVESDDGVKGRCGNQHQFDCRLLKGFEPADDWHLAVGERQQQQQQPNGRVGDPFLEEEGESGEGEDEYECDSFVTDGEEEEIPAVIGEGVEVVEKKEAEGGEMDQVGEEDEDEDDDEDDDDDDEDEEDVSSDYSDVSCARAEILVEIEELKDESVHDLMETDNTSQTADEMGSDEMDCSVGNHVECEAENGEKAVEDP